MMTRLRIICTVSLLLSVAPTTLAGYVPPRNQKPPSDYSKSTGIRGPEEIPLTILAPKTYVGYTVSPNPTFVWFVPNIVDKNICGEQEIIPNIEFNLYQYQPDGRPLKKGNSIVLPLKSGIMSLAFPQEYPKLAVNQTYLVQVTLLCKYRDEINSEKEIYTTAVDLKVVETPANLKANLATASSVFEQAEIYAKAGLWYDALEQALKLAKPSTLGEVGSNYVEELANSESFSKEVQGNEEELHQAEKRITELREIARINKN